MSDNGITNEGRSPEEVDKGASMEQWLFEVKVELGALGLRGREELSKNLGFESVGEGVVEFDLSIKSVERCPCLSQSQAFRNVSLRIPVHLFHHNAVRLTCWLIGILGLNL